MKKIIFSCLFSSFLTSNSFGRCSWLPKDVDSKFLNENVLIVGKVTDVDGGLFYKIASLFNEDFDYYLYTLKVKKTFGKKVIDDEIQVKIFSSEKFDGNFYFDEGDELALYVPNFEKSYTEIRNGPCLPRHFKLKKASDVEAFEKWVKQNY